MLSPPSAAPPQQTHSRPPNDHRISAPRRQGSWAKTSLKYKLIETIMVSSASFWKRIYTQNKPRRQLNAEKCTRRKSCENNETAQTVKMGLHHSHGRQTWRWASCPGAYGCGNPPQSFARRPAEENCEQPHTLVNSKYSDAYLDIRRVVQFATQNFTCLQMSIYIILKYGGTKLQIERPFILKITWSILILNLYGVSKIRDPRNTSPKFKAENSNDS